MFCVQCGANNPDNALVCAQCGRNLQTGTPATPMPIAGTVIPPGTTVPNYLAFSILSTLLCCLPAGIPAIIYSAQVNSKLLAGDIAGAQAASNNAKLWCWISFGLGLGGIVFFVMISLLGVFRRGHAF